MSRRARAGGFTLLEIAVAMAIVGIGMVACMQVFSGSLQLQGRASRQTRAVMRARTEMDKIVFDPPKKLQIENTSPEGFHTRVTVRAAKVPETYTLKTLALRVDKEELGKEEENDN